mmetsp:Transcript_8920/g.22032  ORF Transcript_8920/g.22032 Transcript_8920/m.22032 type:complete len:218 (-) Transcript_8920:1265-1918(-)
MLLSRIKSRGHSVADITKIVETIVRVRPVGSTLGLLRNMGVIDFEGSRTEIERLFGFGTNAFAEFQKPFVVSLGGENRIVSFCQFFQSNPRISLAICIVFVRGALVSSGVFEGMWWKFFDEKAAFLFGKNPFDGGTKRLALVRQRNTVRFVQGKCNATLELVDIRTRRARFIRGRRSIASIRRCRSREQNCENDECDCHKAPFRNDIGNHVFNFSIQ